MKNTKTQTGWSRTTGWYYTAAACLGLGYIVGLASGQTGTIEITTEHTGTSIAFLLFTIGTPLAAIHFNKSK